MNKDLYQDPIIEWSKRKGHEGPLLEPDCRATINNPLCGDRVTVELRLKGEGIVEMAHQVKGCMLCKASSAHLAVLAKGLTLDNIKRMRQDLDKALKSPEEDTNDFPESHEIFRPVRSHKSRHSCVLLVYDAVIDALSSSSL
jgi:nitrogen fixation NifU-like protein